MSNFPEIVVAEMKRNAASLEKGLQLRKAGLLSPLMQLHEGRAAIVGGPEEQIFQAEQSLQALVRHIKASEAK